MRTSIRRFNRWGLTLLLALVSAFGALAHVGGLAGQRTNQEHHVLDGSLPPELDVGDVIFIRVSAKPFREVAAATNSWTNHVGIVVAIDGEEPLIGESTFPVSRTTTLSKFVARSQNSRYVVARLKTELSSNDQQRLIMAAKRRTGILYDTGFNLHSPRQFCSRYVREVLSEATGVNVGEVQTFADLLKQQPGVNLDFWKVWYFGHIPWERETVTPASLLQSPALRIVFDSATATQAPQQM
jgi:hypothetical protein